ncbi:MAG: WbqC family protein [Bacteroidota bacterium]
MQPYFFPYLGYFQAIKAVDKYILYENIDYITEGWMHRNRILVKNQKPIYINANVIGQSFIES